MTKKLLIILGAYLAFSFTVMLVQSCGVFLSYKATICDIGFAAQTKHFDQFLPDTISDAVVFNVTAQSGQKCFIPPNLSFVSSCYATSKCAKWQNEILQNSFKLSLDRELIISGDTVKPGVDLFQLSSFISGVDITKSENDCRSILIKISFRSQLFEAMTFQKGIYLVSFSCKTNDNKTFNKEREVIFKP